MIPDFTRWPVLSMKERLNALGEMLDYWFEGTDHKAQALNMDIPGVIPEPMQWLYGIIRTYNARTYEQSHGDWADGTPVVVFHSIKKPSSLSYDKGFCEFLNESQGVYQCAAKDDTTEDPPVYAIESQNDEWIKVADRFSDFLLFLLILELASGSASSCILGSKENYIGSGFFSAKALGKLDRSFIQAKTEFIIWPLSGDAISIYVSADAALFSIKNEDDGSYIYAVAKTLSKSRCCMSWENGNSISLNQKIVNYILGQKPRRRARRNWALY